MNNNLTYHTDKQLFSDNFKPYRRPKMRLSCLACVQTFFQTTKTSYSRLFASFTLAFVLTTNITSLA